MEKRGLNMNQAIGRYRGHKDAGRGGGKRCRGVVAKEDHKQEMDWRQ